MRAARQSNFWPCSQLLPSDGPSALYSWIVGNPVALRQSRPSSNRNASKRELMKACESEKLKHRRIPEQKSQTSFRLGESSGARTDRTSALFGRSSKP